ncbi:TPA: multidrug efflux MFS transporter [Streptococcus equi subsp. zooepidemicus]|uniref:MDR family MFS transporter n=1 Tax=Streptococcus equi TaxID=1336 RepID=UPI001E41BB1A|nr:MDR family MFS transporter [Streptococcus equi]MCD3460882.1 multidrug efflux MFS transporter [Streptococcus equi subsp. zooepidemicus]HEK9981089.1 multidrug efflux MFS transporter [Streptococcus equi subsp. zooepidemicus]HEL0766681.1 multidrug efflux MFS transporter [Streptococcus equi subsp. zooepidemicus]HEL0789950.1 multidrug efflux MFS transporter [Streptococcus equi subsp. zooepidemicus]HEL1131258.1 multidrug efflux MFS transporter [Streptococcus equi subsp. zooepidemicus]
METYDIHGKPYHRTLMIILLLVGTFAGVLNQTSLGTAIPTLMENFKVPLSTTQQATTWFLLANGIMIPVSAFLATRFSTKRLYMTAYAILVSGLLLAALAPTAHWGVFLAARIVQACAVGITMPLMQVVMINVFPAEQRGAAMGINGLVVGLAPAVGPTLSGWILKKDFSVLGIYLGWRAIFILPLVILLLVLSLSPFMLRDVIPQQAVKLDSISLGLSILGLGAFLWGFTNVAAYGWLDIVYVILPILVGIGGIYLFSKRQLQLEKPFLDIRVFRNKQFTLTTIAIALTMMAMIGVEMMLPLYLQNVRGLSPLNSGMVLLPGALIMGLISPVSGRIYDKIGARYLALLGFTILAAATLPFVFLNENTSRLLITVLYAIRMFGISMILMPLTASAMNALPSHESAHGTAANNTVRQISSSIVVAVLSSVTQNIISSKQPPKMLLSIHPEQYAKQLLEANLNGFHASFFLGFMFAVVGFIVVLFLHKGKVIEK